MTEPSVKRAAEAIQDMFTPGYSMPAVEEAMAEIIERETGMCELRAKVEAYESEIKAFLEIADDFAERRRGATRFFELADGIEDRHPHLSTGKFDGDDEDE